MVFPHTGRTYEGFEPGADGLPGRVNENFAFGGGLYDLRRDPGERYEVGSANVGIVEELGFLAERARYELGDDLTGRQERERR